MTFSGSAALPAPRRSIDARLLLSATALALVVSGALAFALWPERQSISGGGDVLVIARGETVAVERHLVVGKYTLIDFYADWCPNCRKLEPLLGEMARRQPGLAIRKVDVVSWESAVAKQYGITALPRLLLFSPQGEKVAEGDAVLEALQRLFS